MAVVQASGYSLIQLQLGTSICSRCGPKKQNKNRHIAHFRGLTRKGERNYSIWAPREIFFFLVCLSFGAFFVSFWLHPWHKEILGPGTESVSQQLPKPLQRQSRIFNLLCHQGTPVCLFIGVVLLEDLGIGESFQEINPGLIEKLQLLAHVSVTSDYACQLKHQSGREARHTQDSNESALPSHRNLKYTNLRGLSQMECPKSTANRCSPGNTGIRGGISQPDTGGQRQEAGRKVSLG